MVNNIAVLSPLLLKIFAHERVMSLVFSLLLDGEKNTAGLFHDEAVKIFSPL